MLKLLHRLPPEAAHDLSLLALRLGLVRQPSPPADPMLEVRVSGKRFRNPLGLAAGFDKNARAVLPLMRLGFGFVETGSVTPLSQSGNEKPRLFRLPAEKAISNRMGLGSDGLDAVLRRLQTKKIQLQSPAALGISLALDRASICPETDFTFMVSRIWRYVDYITLNLSCPNAPSITSFEDIKLFSSLIRCIAKSKGKTDIFLKVSPDISDGQLEEVVECAINGGATGLVISNSSIWFPPNHSQKKLGALSGPPIFDRSTIMLAKAYLMAEGKLVFIGCGGVASGRDAMVKIRAGASLVQILTSLVYGGPGTPRRILAELSEEVRKSGAASVSDLVGVDAKSYA